MKKPTTPPTLPFDTDRFREAWQTWGEFRRLELKKPLGPISTKEQLKFLGEMSEDMALACMSQSMRNSWQGLFPVAKAITTAKIVHFEQGGGF
jgi:hypothetical protein